MITSTIETERLLWRLYDSVSVHPRSTGYFGNGHIETYSADAHRYIHADGRERYHAACPVARIVVDPISDEPQEYVLQLRRDEERGDVLLDARWHWQPGDEDVLSQWLVRECTKGSIKLIDRTVHRHAFPADAVIHCDHAVTAMPATTATATPAMREFGKWVAAKLDQTVMRHVAGIEWTAEGDYYCCFGLTNATCDADQGTREHPGDGVPLRYVLMDAPSLFAWNWVAGLQFRLGGGKIRCVHDDRDEGMADVPEADLSSMRRNRALLLDYLRSRLGDRFGLIHERLDWNLEPTLGFETPRTALEWLEGPLVPDVRQLLV
jgi:hypothetical protein